MAQHEGANEVRVGLQGRVVIPAALRRALDFCPGDRLLMREEDGRLVLEKAATIERRLKARFKHIPQEERLADQVTEERRADTRWEHDG